MRINNLELEGYQTFTRNRKEGNMGGIATSIKNIHALDTLKIAEGNKCEFIVTQHELFDPPINVINMY